MKKSDERIAVVVSGDPGLYSFQGWLQSRIAPSEYEVIPGISSFQVACSRLRLSWQNAEIISLHGRPRERLLPAVLRGATVVLFTDYKNNPHTVASYLLENGIPDRKVFLAQDVSYPHENIVETTLDQIREPEKYRLCVMIIMGEKSA